MIMLALTALLIHTAPSCPTIAVGNLCDQEQGDDRGKDNENIIVTARQSKPDDGSGGNETSTPVRVNPDIGSPVQVPNTLLDVVPPENDDKSGRAKQ